MNHLFPELRDKRLIDSIVIKWTWITKHILTSCTSKRFIVYPIEHIMKILSIKPVLENLEIHLVDHCNLNCKACDHLSPIADQWFASPEVYFKDLKQLKKLFSGIDKLSLLGGEPLLHPEVERFLVIARTIFPKSNILLMTNGILLDKMPDSFWTTCKKTSTEIALDVYPPYYKKEKQLLQLAKVKEVKIKYSRVHSFQAWLNLRGDSNPQLSFQKCAFRTTHQLKEGKLFVCVLPMVAHYFNKRFGTNLPTEGCVDIHKSGLTGWAIVDALSSGGFSTCKYCATGKKDLTRSSFEWSTSTRQMVEWDYATYQ
jgi:organic radical activating enzyme